MAMSAHFFTSLHPCFKESGTCDGVGKQGLVRHSQSPLRPVFESHDSQYIDRKTRRSPSRWSHSLTLPRAPRTVRTAFYMTCFIFTGVSSEPDVRERPRNSFWCIHMRNYKAITSNRFFVAFQHTLPRLPWYPKTELARTRTQSAAILGILLR